MGLEWIVHLSDQVISIWEGVWVDSNERSALTQRLQKHIYTIYKEEFPVLLNVWSVQDLVLLLFIETFSQLLLVYNSVFSSVQSLSHVRLFATPQTAARQASLSITNSQSLLKFMSIGSVMPSNHSTIVPFSSCLQSFPASGSFPTSQFFAIMWPKYWSFSFNISPSNEYSGLISFRMDCLDLLAVQGTFKSLLQYHSSKASILWHSAFFIVQLSHPCMTTRKTISLTKWTFVGKVMSLLFNMLSRLVITCLPSSKHPLISWLKSPSTVILEPQKIKLVTVSITSSSICHEVMGPDAIIFLFWILSFKPTSSLSSFFSSRGLLVPLHFLP